MNPPVMQRHQWWRTHYRERRYAGLLTQEELNRRLRDLLVNMLVLTGEAKIGLQPLSGGGPRWMELFTHMLEEMLIRHGPYPAGFTRDILQSEPFPNFVSELGTKAAEVFSAKALSPGQVFVKFGRAKYMRDLYERGALRIQPASYFSGVDHNGAVRDDELSIPLSLVLTREDIVKVVKNPQDVPAQVRDQRLDIALKFQTDYWLYCVSQSVEPRLFVDFAADSCVVIKDKAAFTERLLAHAAVALPGSQPKQGPAAYVDPLLPVTTKIQIPSAKHFRYSYQEEFRFTWVPSTNTQRLQHVDIEIGPLKEIAELVSL